MMDGDKKEMALVKEKRKRGSKSLNTP